ncbi:MAG: glycosyltransferase family 2 protein [Lachnospiraceae bacterium]|nr:glycosyltransferase family 2 protein [Lachnospiraceae bacterium]
MKEIGIVICNYNKASYVCKCIETVLASDIDNFQVYVVDNASTDTSVEEIQKNFGEQVEVIVNQENLGGSGGFNTGIKKVVESGHKYLMCLDNDVQVTKDAIRNLYEFLEEHKQVGMVGSKVYHLQEPEYVQQMGLYIHFDNFSAETIFADVQDNSQIPDVVYCDTVAACSLMMPVSVVKEVGMMPEDNFIYWDDMEWGYKVKLAGYQVAAYGKSKVYHEMSANVRRENTFATYYLWRNRMHFFMKYTKREQWERMSICQLRSVFDSFYESMYREEHSQAQTIMAAFLDGLMLVRGKAEEGRILKNLQKKERFISLIENTDSIYVEDEAMKEQIQKIKPDINFVEKERAGIAIRTCEYIMDVKDFSMEYIYVDCYWNVMADENDIEAIKEYAYSLQLFLYTYQGLFLSQMEKLRVETEN